MDDAGCSNVVAGKCELKTPAATRNLQQGSVCLNSVTTVFLLAKRVHFLVRITPAVRTRGSHFQFTFYRFAISQFANYQTRIAKVLGTFAPEE